MTLTKAFAAAIVMLVAAVVGYRATGPWHATQPSADAPAPDVGYTLLDGRRATIGTLRGKVVLVSFWATDCAPCVKDMPQLIATHERFKARGLETLAVSMNYNPPAYVIGFAESRKLPFGVVIDNTGEIAQRFGNVQVTPTSLLIDRQGRIVQRIVGEPDFKALNRRVEALLAAG